MKLTDFDYLTGDHHLQMVKAAIPYVNAAQQRFLSFFVRLRELQRTVSLFREEPVGAMGVCPVGEGPKGSALEIMKAIRPYGNAQEQDFIDRLCNFLSGPRIVVPRQDLAAAQRPLSHMDEDAPPTEIVPEDIRAAQTSSRATARPFAGLPSCDSAAPVADDALAQPPDSVSPAARPSFVPSMSSIEQLKNFLPSDQQARFEQAAFVLQALQQFT